MKKAILILCTISLVFFSCENQTTDELSDQEKAEIKSEIAPLVTHIMKYSELVDFEKAAEPMSTEPGFIGISMGQILDYDKFVKVTSASFKEMESQKFNESFSDYIFINRENVIATLGGSAYSMLKNGQRIDLDPFAATFLFKKIDGKWKVVYFHESGIIPSGN